MPCRDESAGREIGREIGQEIGREIGREIGPVGGRPQRAGRETQLEIGGTRGAHLKHGVHVCDLRRVEVQWLVEGTRLLASQKRGKRKVRLESVGRGRRKQGRMSAP